MKFLLSALLLLLIISCNRSRTTAQDEVKVSVDSLSDKNAQFTPENKTMVMTFVGYEEGDYPHVIFKEIATGEDYDFRYLEENYYGEFKILLEESEAAFGFKANPEYINKSFTVDAELKTVADTDLNGEAIKAQGWVIRRLTQAN